ncbi:MAG TPA: hypothetical protein VIT45_12340 [Allosphingosinicella sp.]
MRPGLFFALLAFAFAPAAAIADATARYRIPGGQEILIEASDDGHGRFTPEGEGAKGGYAVFTPDDSFLIFPDDGVTRVMRFADFRAALDAMIAKSLAQIGGAEAVDTPDPAPTASAEARMAAAGRSEVNGRSGTLYRDRAAAANMGEIVISDDPALAPVGRVFAKAMLETPMFGDLIGGAASDWKRELAALLDKGAPLRLSEIDMVSATSDKIPAERFALPSAPISRAEFERLVLKRQRAPDPDAAPASQ